MWALEHFLTKTFKPNIKKPQHLVFLPMRRVYILLYKDFPHVFNRKLSHPADTANPLAGRWWRQVHYYSII
jgi:hypothetical protein